MTATTIRPGSPAPDLPTASGPPPDAGIDRRRWAMLGVLVAGVFMVLLDATIVNVALPTLRSDLHASGSALELVVSGYAITYAMLLITGARLGAIFGSRRLFLIGLSLFTVSSLACGLAPGTAALIVARFAQGAGAAALVPQILSVIQREFSGSARTRALGVYSAVVAVGAVSGQVLGGVLISANLFGEGWRPVFLVNIPVGIVIAVLTVRLVPAERTAVGRRLDVPGLLTGSAAVLLVVLPLVLGREEGWPWWTWASLAAGALMAVWFVHVERAATARGDDPLVDLRVVRTPGMAAGLATLAVAMIGYGGFLFSFALHLQGGLGESALRAGLTFAPAAAAFGAAGYWWRRLPGRIHHGITPAGFALAAVGYLLLAADLHGGSRGGIWLELVLVALGGGLGFGFGPLLSQALVHVPAAKAADASGLLTTTIQLAQVVGVAVFGSLFLSLATHHVGHASAIAVSTVDASLTGLTVAGLGGALLLARTVRRAAVAQPTSAGNE
ncbi:MAG TPA: MFS transporter [Mycobacteriales bacterium]